MPPEDPQPVTAAAIPKYRVTFGPYSAAIGLTRQEAEDYAAKWNRTGTQGSLWPVATVVVD